MTVGKLYGTFVLLLYLQENYAQQGLNNNQNVGVNSGLGFQQQPPQRTNALNNANQIPTGGLNINVLQGNLQQANGGNIQQQLSLPANLQPQAGSGSLANVQFNKQGLAQLPPGLAFNPTRSQANCPQINNVCNQNTPPPQQPNNVNTPFPNSLAELAALKGPSLLSLFASQINGQPQQNQQMANFSPVQNQLTDIQKQILARAIQGPSPCNMAQQRPVVENRPTVTVQGLPVTQQPQAIVTPVGQLPYTAVQAQLLPAYIQNQPVPVTVVEEPSALSFILSDTQPDAQYFYPPYQVQKRESKSNLKSLIPLIIDLLKEKNACGCRNCGCPNNGIGNSIAEPTIFGGYSNVGDNKAAENKKRDDEDEEGKKESKGKKSLKKNVINDESEEGSEENDSDYEDDSTGD
ncbi:uncharacterized protein LOC118262281 [Spodoptera frugiperda]|uniref:Uncharacterized protein LOC118262281 n=1 Tax=Spodoptera frugiperda TaxID=7108 RepID=A0A9R0CU22_SPOFR|nr:uncharacterized protein LOC118262281 [Spodoptera frugiperda]